jgi:hypothetical protein
MNATLILILMMPLWSEGAIQEPARSPAAERGPTAAAKPASDDKVSASALMRKVYDSLAWVETARTFRIRSEYRIRSTDEGLRFRAKHPPAGLLPGAAGKPDDRTFCVQSEWAWDPEHVLHRTKSFHEGPTAIGAADPVPRPGESLYGQQTRIWNGKLAIECGESQDPTTKSYVLDNKLGLIFGEQEVSRMAQLPWGPGGAYHFWWFPAKVAEDRDAEGVRPEDFELAGQEEVSGRSCHVVVSRAGHYRMHIGAADGHLYRRTFLVLNRKSPGYDSLAICRRIGGPSIKTVREFHTWARGLPPDQRRRCFRALSIAEFEFTWPVFEQNFGDYREVSPGCWLAFQQTIDSFRVFDVDKPFLESHSDQTVTEVTVNQPLPRGLFDFELPEGVRVSTDWRYNPPIHYVYSKSQTEAERAALCAEERSKRAGPRKVKE